MNIMIVFLVSGLWHGANVTFLLWGAVHGLLQIVERMFEKTFGKLTEAVRWMGTFACVNLLWLLFRAESIAQWWKMLGQMFRFQNMAVSDGMIDSFVLPETPFLLRLLHLTATDGRVRGFSMLMFIVFASIVCLIPENNYKTQNRRTAVNMVLAAVAFVWGFLCFGSESVFVYFNF